MSENGAIFDGKHDPHCADILRVGIHFDPHRQPDLVATATQYVTTHWRPATKITSRFQANNINDG